MVTVQEGAILLSGIQCACSTPGVIQTPCIDTPTAFKEIIKMSTMTIDDRREHAKRALTVFKGMIATVYEPLLRAVTGKPKLKVLPASQISATDGKTVWLMVPWVLGETREHDYALCNKRDPLTFVMRCDACRVRDAIDGVVFHESAHITSDSFEPVEPEKMQELVKETMPFIDADALKLPREYKGRPLTVMGATTFIEPVYLPQIYNAVEDIYVNRRLYKHRPGTEKSNLVRTIAVFNEGFHQADGTLIKWSEQPEGMQAIMAVYLLGCRLPDLIDKLCDEAQIVRHDPVLQVEMENVPSSGSAYDRAEVAFRVLARLRELGFCIPPSQRPPEEEPTPVPTPQGQEDEDEEQEPTPGGGSTQGQEESDEDEDAEQQGGESGESEDSEESEDEDAEPSSGGAPGDEESYEDSDEKAEDGEGGDGDESEEDDDDEADDAKDGEGSGDSEDDDDAEAEDQDPSGGGDEGDDEDEESDDDDQEFPSGSGDPEADDEDSDEDAEPEGPTPEELDEQEAKEIEEAMKQLMGHEDPEDASPATDPEDDFRPSPPPQDKDAADRLDEAIRWEKFDAPPRGIKDYYDQEPDMQAPEYKWIDPVVVDPGLISGETARLRAVFALNRKANLTRSLKSGSRLDVPHLHRIAQDDFRIFGKKDIPRKRDWFVLVGLDDSASTHTNGAAPFIRAMALSVGNMLNGAGVKFAMYGHGGTGIYGTNPRDGDWSVRHLIIKAPEEPWSEECKERVNALGRDNTCNFDGHTMEQYRKIIATRRESDKMLLYFTDGEMPMMNYLEEREILEKEISILKSMRVNLFGVGYQTTSPSRYGMDTIEVQDDRDLPALTHGLAQRLGR